MYDIEAFGNQALIRITTYNLIFTIIMKRIVLTISMALLLGLGTIPASAGITPENRVLALTETIENTSASAEQIQLLEQIGGIDTFQALLLAGKYLDSKDSNVAAAAAKAVIKIASANKQFYGPDITAMLHKAADILGGKYETTVTKLLASQPKDKGFVSMFNGKDLTGWKGLVENPIARSKMTPAELKAKQAEADKLMNQNWKVKDGILQFTGDGFDNLCSTKHYGNFEMYVDWMIEPDGDAGVYLRGTPQVQIWDIARTDVGAEVGSGGLYNNKTNEDKPSKVADNPVGEWNTFYIKMIDDKVTVVLNGEKVVDNVTLENYWDRSLPIFPIEQIELQAHGTLVSWRNIYIHELPPTEPFKLSAEEEKDGFKILFDGTNLDKWTGNKRDYVCENGTITLYPPMVNNAPEGGGNLYTKDEFSDFVLRFEFQLTPAANNGLGIRTPMEGDAAYVGMELQILDDRNPAYADITPYQAHGSVYGVIAAERDYLKPVGEWNYEEVYAKGDHIKVTLNGHVILDGNIREAAKNGTADGREHPGLFNPSGHIGFLGHGSEVRFKNIRIKEL